MKKNKLLRLVILVGVLLLIFSVTPAVFADESEPNNSSGTADVLMPPSDADLGDISPIGDNDWWVMGGASVGDLIFAYIDTTGATSIMKDSTLNVSANDGITLIEYDDDDGPDRSSVVAGANVTQAGDVYFMVGDFANNDELTPYWIYAAVLDPATDSMTEVEPNNTAGNATPITAFKIVNANMPGYADSYDYFSFSASAGDVIAVSMDNDPDDDVNLFPSELEILGTDGSTVLATGDNTWEDGNAAGAVTIPAYGTYYVRVSLGTDSQDTDYRFVIHLQPYLPPPALMTIDKDVVGDPPVMVMPGGTVQYTINVTNTGTADALDVLIWDTLPAWFTYASTDSIVDTCTTRWSTVNPIPGNTTPLWGYWDIPSGYSVVITFTADVDLNIPAGTYQNNALADGDNFEQIDDIGSQPQDSDTPQGQDPAVDEDVFVQSQPPPPSAVPTLSQWGMIAMGILLAAALVWSVRRRWVISAGKS
jgi:uncharacterized repeat protein (TIGR01451 family)